MLLLITTVWLIVAQSTLTWKIKISLFCQNSRMKWHKRTNGNDPSIEEFDTSLYEQA